MFNAAIMPLLSQSTRFLSYSRTPLASASDFSFSPYAVSVTTSRHQEGLQKYRVRKWVLYTQSEWASLSDLWGITYPHESTKPSGNQPLNSCIKPRRKSVVEGQDVLLMSCVALIISTTLPWLMKSLTFLKSRSRGLAKLVKLEPWSIRTGSAYYKLFKNWVMHLDLGAMQTYGSRQWQ